MSGPAGVTALVLAETVAGGLVLLFLTPLWGEVKRGFFTLTGSVLLVLSFATWGAAAAGRVPGSEAGVWSVRLSAALAFVNLVWVGLMFAKRHAAARVIGIVSVPLSIAVLGAMAGTAEGTWAVAFLQLLAGAAFLGAVIDGLLLGHWYLTDRGLTRKPINRMTVLLFVGVGLEAAALLLGGFGPTEASTRVQPAPHVGGPGLVDRARDGRGDRAHRRDDPGDAEGHEVLGRAVRDRLLLPRRDHRAHRGVRRQGNVPPVAMDVAVMVLGFVAEVIAWSLVARGRNVWTTMTPVLATMGVVALVVGPIAWSPDVAPGVSLAVGLGLGVLLYVATRIAMVIMARWGTFRRHSLEMYRKQGGLSLGIALLALDRALGAGRGAVLARVLPGPARIVARWPDRARGGARVDRVRAGEPRRARTSRSRPAPWSAARCGSRSRGGRAGCSRPSPATSSGRG